MEGVCEVRPNVETHPEFGDAISEAKEAGVKIEFIKCKVETDRLYFDD